MEIDLALLKKHVECLDSVCERWTHCLIAVEPIPFGDIVPSAVPQTAGVYVVRHETDIRYIGKSKNLRTRVCTHHLGSNKCVSALRRKVSKYLNTDDESRITEWLKGATIGWLALGSHRLTLAVEDYAIEEHSPPFNGRRLGST